MRHVDSQSLTGRARCASWPEQGAAKTAKPLVHSVGVFRGGGIDDELVLEPFHAAGKVGALPWVVENSESDHSFVRSDRWVSLAASYSVLSLVICHWSLVT